MKATHNIIKEIIESLEAGKTETLTKMALRYRQDTELLAIHKLMQDNTPTAEFKAKLQALHNARKFESAGTHLPLKDRRNLTTDRKKTDDY